MKANVDGKNTQQWVRNEFRVTSKANAQWFRTWTRSEDVGEGGRAAAFNSQKPIIVNARWTRL